MKDILISTVLMLLLACSCYSSVSKKEFADVVKNLYDSYDPKEKYTLILKKYIGDDSRERWRFEVKVYGITIAVADWDFSESNSDSQEEFEIDADSINFRTLLKKMKSKIDSGIGPGAFKVDIHNFPPETLSNDFKRLLAIKERKEKMAKGQ